MKNYLIRTLAVIVLVMGGVNASIAQKPLFNAADTHELLTFQLNDDLIERYHNATMAFIEWGKAHQNETFKDDDNDKTSKNASDTTISDMTAGFTKHPQFEIVMRSKGITPRQYVDTMLVLIPGLAMVAMDKQGMAHKDSPIISAANIDYIKRNYDHLSKIANEMAGGNQ
jgi:hypothetical protein